MLSMELGATLFAEKRGLGSLKIKSSRGALPALDQTTEQASNRAKGTALQQSADRAREPALHRTDAGAKISGAKETAGTRD